MRQTQLPCPRLRRSQRDARGRKEQGTDAGTQWNVLEDVDAVQAQLHRVVAALGCGRRLDGPHDGRGSRGLGVGDEQQGPDLLAGVPRHSIPGKHPAAACGRPPRPPAE